MSQGEKEIRQECTEVLEWVINSRGSDPYEVSAARTIKSNGITGTYQERVLSDACQACGMRDSCDSAGDCGIGVVQVPDAADTHQMAPGPLTVTGRGPVRQRYR